MEADGNHDDAELGMEKIILSQDEEAEVEVKETCRVLPTPGNPTGAQREEHRASGHIPYRTRCQECVASRATGELDRRRTGERTACVLAFDYLYLSKSGSVIPRAELGDREDIDLVILVAKDLLGKAFFAHVVPQKCVDQDHFVVDVLVEDIQWLGYQTISLRSDNEPAILNLPRHAFTEARLKVMDLAQIQGGHPSSYDSAGNGETEVAIKQFTRVLATNKLDLERRIGMKMPLSHPVVSYLVAYTAWMITVRVVGPDGRTAYERIRHRPYIKRLVPFGEVVQAYLQPKSPERLAQGTLNAHAMAGVVLGYGAQSHTYVVFADGGIHLFRSIYRLSLPNRWSAEKLQEVNITRTGQYHPRGARVVPFGTRAGEMEYPTNSRVPTRIELRQGDFDQDMGGLGWREHCPKCTRARIHGLHRVGPNGAWPRELGTQCAAPRALGERQKCSSRRAYACRGERVALREPEPFAPPPTATATRVAPPPGARVTPMPPTSPPTEDIDDERSDVDGGDDVPMNPNDMPGDEMYLEYAPTSPGSNDGNQDVAMHIKTIQRRFRQSICEAAEARSRGAPRPVRIQSLEDAARRRAVRLMRDADI